jgi:UDP-glucuronate 4-epimerase
MPGAAGDILCLDNFDAFYDPMLKRTNVAAFAHHRRVKMIEQSFCDLAAIDRLFATERIRQVVHLGAHCGVRPSLTRPIDYEETNVQGTAVLLEAAQRYPVERFLLVSSSTVYGDSAACPFREDAALGTPTTPYAASKQEAESLGVTYASVCDVPVVCLRPFSVYGPRLRPDLALHVFARSILSERSLPLLGDGTTRRDFTHVSDVCDGLLAALRAPDVVGLAINLGRGEPIAMEQAVAILEDALQRRAQIARRPSCPADVPLTFADLTRAQELLGYRPKVCFADGVREFVAWLRR